MTASRRWCSPQITAAPSPRVIVDTSMREMEIGPDDAVYVGNGL